MIVVPSINANRLYKRDILEFNLNPIEYKQFAKYCHIDDYTAWLQRQHEFKIWLDLATILKLPIHEDKQFQREFKLFHLQYECLRAVERLPVSIGPG